MNESERDRRVDAAWSTASREEPPPALDAAIRAAARRAIDAPSSRKRREHWSYPLAAAATVALLAVAIAQLTPPERVAPMSAADRAVAPGEARKDVERQSAAADATPSTQPAAAPASAQSPPEYASPRPASSGVRRVRPAAAAPGPAQRKQEQEAAVAAKAAESAQDKLASAAAKMPAANTAPSAPAVAPVPIASPRREPFPAVTSAESVRRDAYLEGGGPAGNSPATGEAPEQAQARGGLATAKVTRADEPGVEGASARSVEEWIKRIRDLKSEGRLPEAAKELAAFRAFYGVHADALLPSDLRSLQRQNN